MCPIQKGTDGSNACQSRVAAAGKLCPIQKGTYGSIACQCSVAAAGKLCVQYKRGHMVLLHVSLV